MKQSAFGLQKPDREPGRRSTSNTPLFVFSSDGRLFFSTCFFCPTSADGEGDSVQRERPGFKLLMGTVSLSVCVCAGDCVCVCVCVSWPRLETIWMDCGRQWGSGSFFFLHFLVVVAERRDHAGGWRRSIEWIPLSLSLSSHNSPRAFYFFLNKRTTAE